MQNIVVIATVCCALTLHFCISAPAATDDAGDQYRSGNEGYVSYGEGADSEIVDTAPNDSSATTQISTHHILSRSTGQFVAITRSGQVSANKAIGLQVTQFYIHRYVHNGRERLTIKSVKYSDRNWYLTQNSKGKFRGEVPLNGNEVFEVEPVSGGYYFVLKAVLPQNRTRNTMIIQNGTAMSSMKESINSTSSGSGSGSGSHSEEEESESENGNPSLPPSQEQDTGNVIVTQPQQRCYLGFSSTNARPGCYDSSNYVEVHLQLRGAIPTAR